jgi:hypothetical protein
LLRTEDWELASTTSNCYAFRKCGEFLAGLPDSCCWSCSPRPSGRWRWPVLIYANSQPILDALQQCRAQFFPQ